VLLQYFDQVVRHSWGYIHCSLEVFNCTRSVSISEQVHGLLAVLVATPGEQKRGGGQFFQEPKLENSIRKIAQSMER
jgi:hypothetical protein